MQWIYDLFAWTWEHQIMSTIFLPVPLTFWIAFAPLIYLMYGEEIEHKPYYTIKAVLGAFALVGIPIAWMLVVGCIGYLIYS